MKPKSSKENPEIWGLTGGIASGKSTAAKIFEEIGVPVLDADHVARGLTEKGGAAFDAVMKRFGTVDRAALRAKVFQDPQAKQDLEKILHPLIRSESLRLLAELGKNSPVVLYEAALLIEAGRLGDFEGIIVIASPRDVRKKRLIERNGFSAALADQILDSQISDSEREKAASFVIQNIGTPEDLREKIQEFISKMKWN